MLDAKRLNGFSEFCYNVTGVFYTIHRAHIHKNLSIRIDYVYIYYIYSNTNNPLCMHVRKNLTIIMVYVYIYNIYYNINNIMYIILYIYYRIGGNTVTL